MQLFSSDDIWLYKFFCLFGTPKGYEAIAYRVPIDYKFDDIVKYLKYLGVNNESIDSVFVGLKEVCNITLNELENLEWKRFLWYRDQAVKYQREMEKRS